jgi:hypothetical protein
MVHRNRFCVEPVGAGTRANSDMGQAYLILVTIPDLPESSNRTATDGSSSTDRDS